MYTMKVFANFTSFYDFICRNPHVVQNNDHVGKMRQLIREMNTQCPCKRKKYLSQIEVVYRSLEHNLTEPEKQSILVAAGVSQVQFQINGATFLII